MRTSTQEGVICIFTEGELTHIVRKNGSIKVYNVTESGYDDMVELFEANLSK